MVHTKGAVYKINQVTKTVIAAKMPVSDALSCMLYKNYLVAHSNNELVFIDTASCI